MDWGAGGGARGAGEAWYGMAWQGGRVHRLLGGEELGDRFGSSGQFVFSFLFSFLVHVLVFFFPLYNFVSATVALDGMGWDGMAALKKAGRKEGCEIDGWMDG